MIIAHLISILYIFFSTKAMYFLFKLGNDTLAESLHQKHVFDRLTLRGVVSRQ